MKTKNNKNNKMFTIYKMSIYNNFVRIIIVTKVIFVLLAAFNLYLKMTKRGDSDLDKSIEYWKSRVEFVFIFLMSLLLIYVFHPTIDRRVLINKETRLLLFLFGFVLIITANWEDFFKESHTFKMLQMLLGKRQ